VTTILVDLDGTIVDSRAGIVASYRHMLAHLGFDPPPAADLTWLVGPPARRSLPTLIGPDGDVEAAVRVYRAHYEAHEIFNAEVFPGMREALLALRDLPARLFVCTAKPVAFARRITAHFDLDGLFEGVYGADFEGRFDDKGLLIGEIIAAEGIDPARTVMVGDRANDVLAAARHAMASIGVLWGYGDADELTGAGATRLCSATKHLPAAVAGLFTPARG
jgi:phosphoglycolate phosphatase